MEAEEPARTTTAMTSRACLQQCLPQLTEGGERGGEAGGRGGGGWEVTGPLASIGFFIAGLLKGLWGIAGDPLGLGEGLFERETSGAPSKVSFDYSIEIVC